MNLENVVIIGAGGLAREVADVFMAVNQREQRYKIVGFIDENSSNHGKMLNGFPVLGDFSWFDTVERARVKVISGIGNPLARQKIVKKAFEKGLEFCSVMHPTVVITPFVSIGSGVVITAGCIITNQIKIGDHVFLNLDCTVGHDTIIGDFCNINPGVHVSGNVHLQRGCEVGTGAAIIQGVTIGEGSIVGAGAVVTRDLPSFVTAVGIPAKVIKNNI